MTATPEAPARPAARRRWVPYAVIATIGVLFATGAALGADRQPHIWIIPPLVLTTVLLTVLWLSDRRREEGTARDAADRLGLRHTGVQTLPPLAPFLKAAEPPHMLAGHLDDGGPVRVAHARLGRRGALAVVMTEIGSGARLVAGDHGAFGAEDPVDPELTAWLEKAGPGLGLVAEGGTLVIGRQVGGMQVDPGFPALIEVAAEARRRLA